MRAFVKLQKVLTSNKKHPQPFEQLEQKYDNNCLIGNFLHRAIDSRIARMLSVNPVSSITASSFSQQHVGNNQYVKSVNLDAVSLV